MQSHGVRHNWSASQTSFSGKPSQPIENWLGIDRHHRPRVIDRFNELIMIMMLMMTMMGYYD
jgi:hypothetical protein